MTALPSRSSTRLANRGTIGLPPLKEVKNRADAGRLLGRDPADLPRRYAMLTEGNCMWPAIMDGTVCEMDREQTPAEGEIACIIRSEAATPPGEHQALVKIYRGTFCGIVFLETLNPSAVLALPSADVLAIHRVVGTRGAGGAFLPLPPAARRGAYQVIVA